MKPEEKEKIRDAFRRAVARSPVADEAFDAGVTHKGQTLTNRGFVELTLSSDDFYRDIESDIKRGGKTLAEFVQNFADICFPLNLTAASTPRTSPAPGR